MQKNAEARGEQVVIVPVLVVDESSYVAYLMQLRVQLHHEEGKGDMGFSDAGPDALRAVERASAAALGEEATDWRVSCTILMGEDDPPLQEVDGESLALAAAVAIYAARFGKKIPEGWVFSASIGVGRHPLGAVRHIDKKAAVARAAGYRQLVVARNCPSVEGIERVQFVRV